LIARLLGGLGFAGVGNAWYFCMLRMSPARSLQSALPLSSTFVYLATQRPRPIRQGGVSSGLSHPVVTDAIAATAAIIVNSFVFMFV